MWVKFSNFLKTSSKIIFYKNQTPPVDLECHKNQLRFFETLRVRNRTTINLGKLSYDKRHTSVIGCSWNLNLFSFKNFLISFRNDETRFWLSKLSTRSNQDNQRDFEERALRQVELILAKKLSGENFRSAGSKTSYQVLPPGKRQDKFSSSSSPSVNLMNESIELINLTFQAGFTWSWNRNGEKLIAFPTAVREARSKPEEVLHT